MNNSPVCRACRHVRFNHNADWVCDAPQLKVKRHPESEARYAELFGRPFIHGLHTRIVRGRDRGPGANPNSMCEPEGRWFEAA
jgi:hypothetical protein